eukprot:g51537.t1
MCDLLVPPASCQVVHCAQTPHGHMWIQRSRSRIDLLVSLEDKTVPVPFFAVISPSVSRISFRPLADILTSIVSSA